MLRSLYAGIHVPSLPLQALLRLHPELRSLPVAVIDGDPPLQTVCSVNARARKLQVIAGMTKTDAESIPGLRILTRSPQTEAIAEDVVLEYAMRYSPRIEDAHGPDHCAFVLDITGTERLFGPSRIWAEHLLTTLTSVGIEAHIAVSANFDCARIIASAVRGSTMVPTGKEAEILSDLHLSTLALSAEDQETFTLWGIRSLGQLARLPEIELVSRFGQAAKQWRDLALGAHRHTFEPIEPEIALAESCEFEESIDNVDSLLFVAGRMIESLVRRAGSRALAVAALTIDMGLEDGSTYKCSIHPALPSQDRRFLLKLLQLEISAHRPPSGVLALALTAEAGQSSKQQLGLFMPDTPEPALMDITLARLKALVGEDRVGSPVLLDTHRSDAFRMGSFAIHGTDAPGKPVPVGRYTALRRIRPPHAVTVRCAHSKPMSLHDGKQTYPIVLAFGPWRNSGCWWTKEDWQREEWDVLIDSEQHAYLLANDRKLGRWFLEAVYD
ncbi:DNA polymerase Y family protein [Acidicapsa dinghuensis]|uniref:DNA polymerase Y family protein n=1 Tax=Acidicapsa dinghuensis TaxID=2218256 RepID=A0ABW1EBN4_9BACT|nr:DNA polymerase Y family protein [Acidicapsa dinghuensis]